VNGNYHNLNARFKDSKRNASFSEVVGIHASNASAP
jgi:hypothetical protein